MSKELIEQLAKEKGLRKYSGIFSDEYIVRLHELEAMCKAYQAAAPIDNVAHIISESSDGVIAVSSLVAGQLLAMREVLATGDTDEAYHMLYGIADPNYTSLEPWKRLEEIALIPDTQANEVTK
jgi:hypothetical protein